MVASSFQHPTTTDCTTVILSTPFYSSTENLPSRGFRTLACLANLAEGFGDDPVETVSQSRVPLGDLAYRDSRKKGMDSLEEHFSGPSPPYGPPTIPR